MQQIHQEILDQLQLTVLPQKMMAEKVEPDIFKPPHQQVEEGYQNKIRGNVKGIPVSVHR